MVYYSGYRFEYGIKLILLGDGETKSIEIDLRKQPFEIDFQGFYPKQIFVRSEDEHVAPTAKPGETDGTLILEYEEPLPVAGEGTLSPRAQLHVFLLYTLTP